MQRHTMMLLISLPTKELLLLVILPFRSLWLHWHEYFGDFFFFLCIDMFGGIWKTSLRNYVKVKKYIDSWYFLKFSGINKVKDNIMFYEMQYFYIGVL